MGGQAVGPGHYENIAVKFAKIGSAHPAMYLVLTQTKYRVVQNDRPPPSASKSIYKKWYRNKKNV